MEPSVKQEERAVVHVSRMGTYHPDPSAEVAWTVNDTRSYLDNGPSCDDCGACDCQRMHIGKPEEHPACACTCESIPRDASEPFGETINPECIGLPFAFVCLDGGEALCEDCAAQAGLEIVPCDCEGD